MFEDGELVFVVVGEAETYLCGLDYIFHWLSSGYRLYGVADSVEDSTRLYHDAQEAI